MAIFRIDRPGTTNAMIVRARCLSCARDVAVRHAGDEGTMVWRDPEQSTVTLMRNSGYEPEGKSTLIVRME